MILRRPFPTASRQLYARHETCGRHHFDGCARICKSRYEKAEHTDDIIELMGTVLKVAQIALDKTPDLLPILKEGDVVDSGGQGLVYIYEGFMNC